MGRPTSFFVVWGGLAAAALYSPVRSLLQEFGYTDSEQFFEDLLSLITGISVLVIPICVLLALSSRRDKPDSKAKTRSEPIL